jgi:hypothetical protein
VGIGQTEVSASALQAINPLLILIYVPLFSYVIYPAVGRVTPLTPLRKVGAGLFLTAAAFAICGILQRAIDAGESVSAYNQLLAYMVLTAAEVLVSVTCLEFSYTQAPPKMKSLVMSLYLLSVALGNILTSGVNAMIQLPGMQKALEGDRYYWFFAGLMTLAAIVFIPYAVMFRQKNYLPEGATSQSRKRKRRSFPRFSLPEQRDRFQRLQRDLVRDRIDANCCPRLPAIHHADARRPLNADRLRLLRGIRQDAKIDFRGGDRAPSNTFSSSDLGFRVLLANKQESSERIDLEVQIPHRRP